MAELTFLDELRNLTLTKHGPDLLISKRLNRKAPANGLSSVMFLTTKPPVFAAAYCSC